METVGTCVYKRVVRIEDKIIKHCKDYNVNDFLKIDFFALFDLNIQKFMHNCEYKIKLSSIQSLSSVQLFATPWTAAYQASLSITNSWNLLKLMSIELVMPSNHLILCRPFLLLPSIFPSIRVFSNESSLHIGGQSI